MKGYGIQPTIVKAAFKKMNVDVVYVFLPVARSIETVEFGEYDAAVGWVWSEKREKIFHFSDPILESPLVFFHLKSFSFDWETWDDLTGIPIGTIYKAFYGPPFHEALDAGKLIVQKVSKDELNFDKLLYKRIKLFPTNFYVGYAFIRRKYDLQTANLFTHHPRPLKISVYHVLFSKAVKGNKSMMELFNQGLRQLKESGEYKKILEEYNLMQN